MLFPSISRGLCIAILAYVATASAQETQEGQATEDTTAVREATRQAFLDSCAALTRAAEANLEEIESLYNRFSADSNDIAFSLNQIDTYHKQGQEILESFTGLEEEIKTAYTEVKKSILTAKQKLTTAGAEAQKANYATAEDDYKGRAEAIQAAENAANAAREALDGAQAKIEQEKARLGDLKLSSDMLANNDTAAVRSLRNANISIESIRNRYPEIKWRSNSLAWQLNQFNIPSSSDPRGLTKEQLDALKNDRSQIERYCAEAESKRTLIATFQNVIERKVLVVFAPTVNRIGQQAQAGVAMLERGNRLFAQVAECKKTLDSLAKEESKLVAQANAKGVWKSKITSGIIQSQNRNDFSESNFFFNFEGDWLWSGCGTDTSQGASSGKRNRWHSFFRVGLTQVPQTVTVKTPPAQEETPAQGENTLSADNGTTPNNLDVMKESFLTSHKAIELRSGIYNQWELKRDYDRLNIGFIGMLGLASIIDTLPATAGKNNIMAGLGLRLSQTRITEGCQNPEVIRSCHLMLSYQSKYLVTITEPDSLQQTETIVKRTGRWGFNLESETRLGPDIFLGIMLYLPFKKNENPNIRVWAAKRWDTSDIIKLLGF